MSSSPEASVVNGHISPEEESSVIDATNGNQSDSDLSDVQAIDVDSRPPRDAETSASPEQPEVTVEEPSDASDSNASDDGEFDAPESPASVHSVSRRDERASSSESRSSSKRKVTNITEDDYMRENPELYGLRRSV
jgi:chromodomain-helicase-DNA-binding protein 1